MLIINGSVGFIGSHLACLFMNKYLEYRIINLDKLAYSDNLPKIEGL